MSKLDVLKDYSKRGPYDEIWTPNEALDFILPFIPNQWMLWDCAYGNGNLVNLLTERDRLVTWFACNHDFINDPPAEGWDCILTNPPYSKKIQFIERCMELNKPWVLLLPVTTLGVRKCQKYLYDAEIIFLPKRIDFTGKKAPWFAVAWFTWGLNLGKQLNFVED